jgi:hypothetical protein
MVREVSPLDFALPARKGNRGGQVIQLHGPCHMTSPSIVVATGSLGVMYEEAASRERHLKLLPSDTKRNQRCWEKLFRKTSSFGRMDGCVNVAAGRVK